MKGDKLKTPLWQTIIYLALVIGGPILTLYIGALASFSNTETITISILNGSKPAYIGFLTIFILAIIAMILINNIVVKPWKRKIEVQIATLELNYATGVGEKNATKKMWGNLQLKKYLWDAACILFIAFGVYWLLSKKISWANTTLQLYLIVMFATIFFGSLFRLFCCWNLTRGPKLKDPTLPSA